MIPASGFSPLPVAVPLLGAGALAAIRRWASRAIADSIGIAFASVTLIFATLLLLHSLQGTSVYWFGNWHPRGAMVIGIGFVVGPIGAGLATLTALITLLSLIFSWRFIDSGGNHFQPLVLVFLGAMCGFVLTGDIFNLFVFFELMSTAAFALCGLKTEEPAPLQGSFNFAVTNTVAAFLVLTGIAFLYAATGALNMAQIGAAIGARHDSLVVFAFTLLTCGFFIKAAIVPFHLWLPDAHAVAPTPVCVLFSALMVELGLYAVVRIYFSIFEQALSPHASTLRFLLMSFGAITVVLGGTMCYAEHHLKRLLAFSTVCHVGLMLVIFSLQNSLAIAAMLAYLLAHALIKSELFFTSGIILHRLRSISERVLFRRGTGLRGTACLWFIGAAGLAGLPPFVSMIGEAGTSQAAKIAGVDGISWLFFFAGSITSAAVLRAGMHIFLGAGENPLTDRAAEVGEMPETTPENKKIFWYHFAPPLFCICGAIALTFLPGWQNVLRDSSSNFANQQAYIHTVYSTGSAASAQPGWNEEIPSAAMHGFFAFIFAIALAVTSVFRAKLPHYLRIGSFLERGFRPLRLMQSGHPGDYVLWLTIGLVVFGSVAALALVH